MASDTAETSGRANVQESVRDLAESTGGFLIGDSNDLRVPLRHVNEEISSYYEVSFNPGIQTYDGSFRKIAVTANRKDLVIHARNGYFALPPEARSGAVGSGMSSPAIPCTTKPSAAPGQASPSHLQSMDPANFGNPDLEILKAAAGHAVQRQFEPRALQLHGENHLQKKCRHEPRQ